MICICGYKKWLNNKISSPSSFGAVVGSGIRDKHSGSAAMVINRNYVTFLMF
jgi:hypothetical protein